MEMQLLGMYEFRLCTAETASQRESTVVVAAFILRDILKETCVSNQYMYR